MGNIRDCIVIDNYQVHTIDYKTGMTNHHLFPIYSKYRYSIIRNEGIDYYFILHDLVMTGHLKFEKSEFDKYFADLLEYRNSKIDVLNDKI